MGAVLGEGKSREAGWRIGAACNTDQGSGQEGVHNGGTRWETGVGGKPDHVVEGLRQLVNAARVGRLFYSDWTQELLYTCIKVPGAMGLENSRPVHVGLL